MRGIKKSKVSTYCMRLVRTPNECRSSSRAPNHESFGQLLQQSVPHECHASFLLLKILGMATVTTTEASIIEDGSAHSNEVNKSEHAPTLQVDEARHIHMLEVDDTSGPIAAEGREYPTRLKLWLFVVTIGAVLALGGLDTNIVATAVPSITDHFHTVADVGWYSSAFRLCSCAFQFMFGKMYKLFSFKQIFLLAIAIFLVGSLLCATAASSAMFVVGRAVTGMGFAGIIGGFFTILGYIIPLQRRPFF